MVDYPEYEGIVSAKHNLKQSGIDLIMDMNNILTHTPPPHHSTTNFEQGSIIDRKNIFIKTNIHFGMKKIFVRAFWKVHQ